MKSPHPLKRTGRSKGFTLLELIISLVIIAVLGLIAVPIIPNVQNERAYFAIRNMRSAVVYAQNYAVQTQNRTRVTFDNASDTITLERDNGAGGWSSMTHPGTKSSFVLTLDSGNYSGVQITAVNIGSTDKVIFDSEGIPYNGSEVALTADGSVTITNSLVLNIVQETGYMYIS